MLAFTASMSLFSLRFFAIKFKSKLGFENHILRSALATGNLALV